MRVACFRWGNQDSMVIISRPRFDPEHYLISVPPPPTAVDFDVRDFSLPPPPPSPAVALSDGFQPFRAGEEMDDGSSARPSDHYVNRHEQRQTALEEREMLVEARLADAEERLAEAQDEASRILEAAREEAAELIAAATTESQVLREQLEEDAQAERAAAVAQREEILVEAHVEAERIKDETRESAHNEGFNQGHLEGVEHAQSELAEKLGIATRVAENAIVDRRDLLKDAEAEVVRLSVHIARRIISRELRTDPSLIRDIAESALRFVTEDGTVKLRINPEDHAELRSYWSRAHSSGEMGRTFEIVPDPVIGRGGVLIETRSGTVDAQLETQLDEIARALGVGSADPYLAE